MPGMPRTNTQHKSKGVMPRHGRPTGTMVGGTAAEGSPKESHRQKGRKLRTRLEQNPGRENLNAPMGREKMAR